MAYPRPAQISIPLDIADVDVLKTEITGAGKLLVTVESRDEMTSCGICGQKIKCSYGHGAAIELRHLPVLGYETYIHIRPKRGHAATCAKLFTPANHDTTSGVVRAEKPPYQSV